jgi:hypothetical protein
MVDIIVGMFWTDTTLDEGNRTMTRYEYEFLRRASWPVEGWIAPQRPGDWPAE